MPKTGGFSPLPWGILFTRKRGLLLFSKLIRFLNLNAHLQRGNSHLALLHSNFQPRTLDLARDVMQPHVYRVPSWTAPSGRVSLPPAGFRPPRAAMTSPAH